MNGIEKSLLSDGLSIAELYYIEKGEKWVPYSSAQGNDVKSQHPMCPSKTYASYKQKIKNAIEKVLKFYGSHEDLVLKQSRDLPGLSFLVGVDDKYGKQLQAAYNISSWLTRTCNQLTSNKNDFCAKSIKTWKQSGANKWKSKDVIDSIITSSVDAAGEEKDYAWSVLNGHCQHALLLKCEVPYICEKILYDPIPKSQYLLAKQMLQRILTEQSDCPEAKKLLSKEVNDQLCSKMYQEAQLISEMSYPHVLRELFVNYVAFCGYLRYPNFFRQDWIENMITWQSESEYGCLVDDKGYKQNFMNYDGPIARRSSPEEKEKGLVPDEMCLPHLTTFALAAYSMSWDYIEENCN
ncbi:unnamed protein product [Orchesella dallaii]|uniref:Uncharacterized protein n=1 Tax=Orchesella dallaii TaxID=48710 RepID=A0ABP1PLT0_9HEXA